MSDRSVKIISGGQTGVDRAALDAARKLGLPCGGYCPAGRRSEDGIVPPEYPLFETASSDYAERTELNVTSSDGTLIVFTSLPDTGTALTMRKCREHNKPFIVQALNDQRRNIIEWMKGHNIYILNVAGPRESSEPGIGHQAYFFLIDLFEKLRKLYF